MTGLIIIGAILSIAIIDVAITFRRAKNNSTEVAQSTAPVDIRASGYSAVFNIR